METVSDRINAIALMVQSLNANQGQTGFVSTGVQEARAASLIAACAAFNSLIREPLGQGSPVSN